MSLLKGKLARHKFNLQLQADRTPIPDTYANVLNFVGLAVTQDWTTQEEISQPRINVQGPPTPGPTATPGPFDYGVFQVLDKPTPIPADSLSDTFTFQAGNQISLAPNLAAQIIAISVKTETPIPTESAIPTFSATMTPTITPTAGPNDCCQMASTQQFGCGALSNESAIVACLGNPAAEIHYDSTCLGTGRCQPNAATFTPTKTFNTYTPTNTRTPTPITPTATATPSSTYTPTPVFDFGRVSVSGQSDVVADQLSDTMTLVAGSNITITTSAAGDSVTIAASGGSGGCTWSAVSGASQAIAVNNCYISQGINVSYSLPASCAVGDMFEIADAGGLWTITQGSGQQIVSPFRSTTAGVSGYVSNVRLYSSGRFLCVVANTTWLFASGSSLYFN